MAALIKLAVVPSLYHSDDLEHILIMIIAMSWLMSIDFFLKK